MTMSPFVFFGLAILAGAMIAIQSVLNAALGEKTGHLGSVLILTLVSVSVLLILIRLFPSTADLRQLPGLSQWYLYLGGILGIAILAAPIFLIPRIGATATLSGLVVGQLLLAVLIDHFGAFNVQRVEIDLTRLFGVVLLALGAYLITK
jgi:bacterial/archaeal transporter family-2 protein